MKSNEYHNPPVEGHISAANAMQGLLNGTLNSKLMWLLEIRSELDLEAEPPTATAPKKDIVIILVIGQ
uniref:Uncharacterized protein n=1 Tax=Setaria digitata TaxID=48799 RepID=A0A915Q1Z0_9BILA